MNWIGGTVNETTHRAEYSEDAVRELMLSRHHWQLVQEMDVPFVQKRNKRTFEYTISHCMILRRI